MTHDLQLKLYYFKKFSFRESLHQKYYYVALCKHCIQQAYLGLCTHCGQTVYYAIIMCGQMVLLCIINVILSKKFFHISWRRCHAYWNSVYIYPYYTRNARGFLSRSLCWIGIYSVSKTSVKLERFCGVPVAHSIRCNHVARTWSVVLSS